MDTLTVLAIAVLVLLGAAVVFLAACTLLEGWRTTRLLRTNRRLRRRTRSLVQALEVTGASRDHWRAEAVRWERAYREAARTGPLHVTQQHPVILTLVKEEDAPVA